MPMPLQMRPEIFGYCVSISSQSCLQKSYSTKYDTVSVIALGKN